MTEKKYAQGFEALGAQYQQGLKTLAKSSKIVTDTISALSQLQGTYVQNSFNEMQEAAMQAVKAQPLQYASISQKALSNNLNRTFEHANAFLQTWSKAKSDWIDQVSAMRKPDHS